MSNKLTLSLASAALLGMLAGCGEEEAAETPATEEASAEEAEAHILEREEGGHVAEHEHEVDDDQQAAAQPELEDALDRAHAVISWL